MLRLHAPVAAEVEVVALLGGDDAEVLALRLGALAGASGDGGLQLVRRAEALVTILQADGEADRVLHAEAAPGAPDAGLHRAQRFPVGVSGLEACGDEVVPDVRQLVEPRAEEVHPLCAGDFRVQAELLRRAAQRDELIGGDLTARHARDHRVAAVPLDVGQESVVGVLEPEVPIVEHVLVPGGGEDGRHGGLADLAPRAAAMTGDERVEAVDPVQADEVEQLLARVGEVLAEMVGDLLARALHLPGEQLAQERHARSAAGARGGGGLDRPDRGQVLRADGLADDALGDVLAGADGGCVRERLDAGQCRTAIDAREDELLGLWREGGLALGDREEVSVARCLADQHAAEETLAIRAQDELLVDAGDRVGEGDDPGAGLGPVRVAEARDLHPHELELGAHVEHAQAVILAGKRGHGGAGHLVAGTDQPVGASAVLRALADGEDVRVGGAAVLVDDDAAALAEGEAAVARQLVAGADAGGEDDHLGGEHAAVGEVDLGDPTAAGDDAGGVLAAVNRDAERLDLRPEDRRSTLVDLHRHQPGRELDHVGLEAHAGERVGGLEAEQATTDDHAGLDLLRPEADALEVLDGPVDEAAPRLPTGDRRHEGRRAGREDQRVVRKPSALRGEYLPVLTVDGRDAVTQVHGDAGVLVAVGRDQREVAGGLPGEEAGEVHPVVGEPWLLAEGDDVPVVPLVALEQQLDEAVPDHPVADHDEVLLRHGSRLTSKRDATRDAARLARRERDLTLGPTDKFVRLHEHNDNYVNVLVRRPRVPSRAIALAEALRIARPEPGSGGRTNL